MDLAQKATFCKIKNEKKYYSLGFAFSKLGLSTLTKEQKIA
jgi:hypothetical protein